MRTRALLAASSLVLVGLAGCSSASTKSTPDTPAATESTTGSTAASQPFGAACSAVPAEPSDPGSFDGMSKDSVATAASHNPVLSTLVQAVTAAGLGDTLNSQQAITVFAPSNDAFAKIPADTLKKVLADKATLTKILTYHVVPRRISPDQLSGSFKTLEGDTVTVTGSGRAFTVNGSANVICGNVQTANATVYIIDTVLMPKS